MQTRVVTEQPWEVKADVLAVPIPADESGAGILAELDRRVDGALGDFRRVGELAGKPHLGALLRGTGLAADWLLGMGIGPSTSFDRLSALRLGAAIERRLAGRSVRRLAVWLPEGLVGANEPVDPERVRPATDIGPRVDLDLPGLVELVSRGVVEGSHEPSAIYREEVDSAPPELEQLIIVAPGGDASALRKAAERGRIIGEGANHARVLAQRASNDVSPEVLADEATTLGRRHGLKIEVISADRAREMGLNLFLAVGRGSDNPPRFIVMRTGARRATGGRGGSASRRNGDRASKSARPSRSRSASAGSTGRSAANGRLLAMVGKGVTFDSGGLSIKPADRMEEMKMDKTGACTVIAAIATIAQLDPDRPLLAVAPAVENMPGPHSTRPGDVIRALNGKWVEIQNTDAEGRLILADALTYAEQQGATHLVDVATLTGAVERAYGKLVTGVFASPDSWFRTVAQAGARQAERYWQVPLVEEYFPELDSWYADFTNTGGNEGSLVKSGLFLAQFVTRPWAHLDIGGTGYLRKPTPWAARGATGVTHATLVELALSD
jgi:leucyl aminopeptidase